MSEQTLTPSDLPIGMLVFASAISGTLAPSGFDQGVCNLITSGMIGKADGCSSLFAQNIHSPSSWMQPRQNLITQGQYCFPLQSSQHKGGNHSPCDYRGKHPLCFFVKYNTFLVCVTRFSAYKHRATPQNVLLEYTLIGHSSLYGYCEAIPALVDPLSLC